MCGNSWCPRAHSILVAGGCASAGCMMWLLGLQLFLVAVHACGLGAGVLLCCRERMFRGMAQLCAFCCPFSKCPGHVRWVNSMCGVICCSWSWSALGTACCDFGVFCPRRQGRVVTSGLKWCCGEHKECASDQSVTAAQAPTGLACPKVPFSGTSSPCSESAQRTTCSHHNTRSCKPSS